MVFEALIEECILRNYSKRTIELYLHYNKQFIKLIKKSPHQVTQKDIRWYLGVLIQWNRSPATVNLAHNALIFYYSQILKRKFYDIPFQKKEQKIKETLDKEEIKSLIEATHNPKHKLMINMLYATGVRVSELIKIKVEHIDFLKKLLLVKQGKGKKDRYTIISNNNIKEIKKYLEERKTGSNYVFETKSNHISSRTVQAVLKKAKRLAKIEKNVTPHILRHSFATHLKETGIEDSTLQKLMGHKSYRTTQTYAKVTNKHLANIKSPQDFL
jgi:site-specific recombinase XerD